MHKKLKNIVDLVPGVVLKGDANTIITDVVQDSRQATHGALFVCLDGVHVDGHKFIGQAVEHGAVAIITERKNVSVPDKVAVVEVPNIDEALKIMVPAAFDYPSRRMRVIGITGTNGKTTTSYLIRAMLREAGHKVGLIGTIQIMIGDKVLPIHNTTPNVVDLQRTLSMMLEEGMDYVVMEVSSHALDQGRVAGTEIDTAVFTNLTQDHLDYHKTMDNYRLAKAKLFDSLADGIKPLKTAVVNIDDASGEVMLEHTNKDFVNRITYGVNSVDADIRGVNPNVHQTGSEVTVQGSFGLIPLRLKITGMFNIYNVLAAFGAAIAEEVPVATIKHALEGFRGVPGRFELVDCGQPFAVVVDYAHTPDGLENILSTARQITEQRIITVFGCGGDRDKTKRPIMGRIAAEMSDAVILTSDNPRTEDPLEIINEVDVGVKEKIGVKPYEKIADRQEAIFVAIAMAQPGDTVVIAGKGHENYQILKDKTIHFDDREMARAALGGIV